MFQVYFDNIQAALLADTENTELSLRTYFQELLEVFVREKTNRDLIIKHEPRSQQGLGRPDFKITTSYLMTIGLIETKKFGENLKAILNSEQLERYKQFSDNIILTNYQQFLLLKNGEVVLESWLFTDLELQKKRHKVEQTSVDELTNLLKLFFETEPETITKTHDLAVKLSDKARFLKEFCTEELVSNSEENNIVFDLYEGFKKSLLPMLDKRYFADIYAQTLTYSLFLAALNCDAPNMALNRHSAFSLLPTSFPLIKELFHRLDDFPAGIIWAIDEIISILKATDFTAIKKDFTEYRQEEEVFRDPFIYFYEDFLTHYDKTQRELRGVYYTPEPVVSFIIRSIEAILKNDFGIKDGLINKDVTLLDFATGTGTFLLYAFKLAIEQAQKIGDKHYINKVINEQTINNFYGFELLVAPYVVAHLKISEFLKSNGLSLKEGKRLNIFLTNTLTNREPEPFPMMPNVTKEGREASRVKNQEILVITGNPPYSIHSDNVDNWILNLIKEYKPTDEKKLNIDDDYIKFIRFAQWKMEKVEKGVIGIISNNSFLNGITHRKMRGKLINDFSEIFILNLHGNYLENEGISGLTNIFDIKIGVAISIFIKDSKNKNKCKIYYRDIQGSRILKRNFLNNFRLDKSEFEFVEYEKFNELFCKVRWKKRFNDDLNFFIPFKLTSLIKIYGDFWGISEIFNKSSVGIKTKVDKISVDLEKEILGNRIKKILKKKHSFEEVIRKYHLNYNTTWEYNRAIKAVFNSDKIILYDYRPFDKRFIFYDENFLSRSRKQVMDFFFNKKNISLEVARLDDYIAFVSDSISDEHFCGGCTYKFPLYIFVNTENNNNSSNSNDFLFKEDGKRDNFKPDFRKLIKNQYKNNYSPEQILGYIYAVLHSSTYRTKYLEFLKIDFPRIPFTDDEEMFEKLSNIGLELIEHHLLKVNYGDDFICKLEGEGDNFKVEAVKYERIPFNPILIEDDKEIPLTPFDKGGNFERTPFNPILIEDDKEIPLTPFDKGGNFERIPLNPLLIKEDKEIPLNPPLKKGEEIGKVWFNKDRYFAPVSEEIWNFHIGGYQVLDKWLKERKKNNVELSPEDVNHFLSVVNSIAYTIETIEKVDDLTRVWI